MKQTFSRRLEPLQIKYVYTFARLMMSAKISVDSEDPDLVELLTKNLDSITGECFKAYVSSAIRGRVVGFFIDSDRSLRWDFLAGINLLTEDKNPDRIGFKAFEDLPAWNATAYEPYMTGIQDLSNLTGRLELIEIEDNSMSKLNSLEDVQERIASNIALFQASLRNDGFLVHGSGMKVTVHHRNSEQVVKGVDALRDHMLASTDLTEQQMFNKRSTSGGLAGVDQADREHIAQQTIARLTTTWEPVIKLWIRAAGYDPTSVKINWTLFSEDALKTSQVEKVIAETAKLNIESGVLPAKSYTDRYEGGETPSPLPMYEPGEIVPTPGLPF